MIDDHVHPFPLEYAPLEPHAITLDVSTDADADRRRRTLAPGRLYLHLLQAKLADLLGLDLSEAVEARNERAAGDWAG